MPPLFARLLRRGASALAWLEGLAGTRRGAVALFALALAVYGADDLAWPLRTGRDLDEYLYVYLQLLDGDPLLPWSLLFRTPVTPIVVGLTLDGGTVVAELAAAVLYALAILGWSAAAFAFGRRAALVTAVALLCYPGYAMTFHEWASEPVMATAFAGWAYALTRAARRPSPGRFAVAGLGVALLALVRPGNVVLLALAVFPFVLRGAWRDRLAWSGAFAAAAVLPLAAWAVNNGLRYDDFTLARGGNAVVPFYRAFLIDKIVSPENGPASRRLGQAVRRDLLTRDPYKSYGVTEHEIYTSGSFRVHEDLYTLSDEVWGWDSDYATLRDAALEAIRKHPGTYASGVSHTVWEQFTTPPYRVVGGSGSAAGGTESPTVVVRGRKLPRPTEGQVIPAGQSVWVSRPDQSIRDVWTSGTHHEIVFRHPQDRPRFEQIVRRERELVDALTDRSGNAQLARRLNQASRWYPRPALWVLVGLIALAIRRPKGSATLVAIAAGGFLVVLLNALGLFADLHFILPVTPAFVLLGIGGLLGRTGPRWRTNG